ncbi:MAG: adenylate/guanylate cyclase domain-containing protein [Cellvibrionaceae bacterium]
MTQQTYPRAVMFADLSGSSSLYKSLGNLDAKEMIDDTLSAMISEVKLHNGRLIKTIGDEIMVSFEDPSHACHCAQMLQRQASLIDAQLPVRIGVAFGDTLLDQEDLFGDTVNDAAHLTHIARAGQILLTQALADCLSESLRRECHEFDRVTIKGQADKSIIYRLHWESMTQAHNATRVMSIEDNTQPHHVAHLNLQYGEQSLDLLPENTPFILGRDSNSANLRINSDLASREHCEIVFRRGKFVLVDHSTNGTYVATSSQDEIYLRREELPLMGDGKIALGQSVKKGGELVVRFRASS